MSNPENNPKESKRWLKPRVTAGQLARLAPPRARPQRLANSADAWRRARNWIWAWWLWLAIAILLLYWGHHIAPAVLTLVAIALYHVAPESHPARFAIATDLDPDSDEFRLTIEGSTGMALVEGNRAALFTAGDDFYPDMLDAIEAATASITMEQYIFWDGVVGRRFAAAFAERSSAGVQVKLLLDAIGSSTIGEPILKTLESGGCQLAWYRPIHWYTLDRANRRDHRKSLIIDGRIAYTGGAGIADHWIGDQAWRDTEIRVEGPAALAQQAGFAQNWLLSTGEILSGPAFFAAPAPVGDVQIQTILSSPWSGASAAATMYLIAVQSARRSLAIANPYFIPDARVLAMLAAAHRRGVTVTLMLSGEPCDSWWARQNSLRLYGALLEAGVEIYEYLPCMLHQKTMLVDDAWGTVGTTNFDNRSFSLNEETNICFHDRELVASLRAGFDQDLTRCRHIDAGEWKARGLWREVREVVASLLEDQV